MEIRINYKKGGLYWEFECCGKPMLIREQRGKHWNDNPQTIRCQKCKRWLRANSHTFDHPKSISFEAKLMGEKRK